MLTLPDNPTGTLAPRGLVQAVCEIAREHDLLIVCDEIYRDLAYHPDAVCLPAEVVPERAFVTNGLSKAMALGGWRIGFARFPDGPRGDDARRALTGLGGVVWSSLAAPMQQAAASVLDEPDEVREHVARSRRLHRLVTTAAHRELAEALLERHDNAVLPGEAFGDERGALRFRMATSLLLGNTDDERWEALAAEDPVSLPRIRSALDRLGRALRELTGV